MTSTGRSYRVTGACRHLYKKIMADFIVRIENLPELRRAFREYPKIAGPILQKALLATQFVFQKNTLKDDPVPWRTGNLLQSFRFRAGAGQARWFPTARYAPFVEFGTAPHTIVPVNARALAWDKGGGGRYVTAASGRQYFRATPGTTIFAMRVNHPGTRPKPFMKRIVEKSAGEINRLFGQAGDLITKEIARQTRSI